MARGVCGQHSMHGSASLLQKTLSRVPERALFFVPPELRQIFTRWVMTRDLRVKKHTRLRVSVAAIMFFNRFTRIQTPRGTSTNCSEAIVNALNLLCNSYIVSSI